MLDKMKQLLVISILIFIVLLIFPSLCFADSEMTIYAESKTVSEENFSIKIIGENFDESKELAGIKLDIFYDNTAFKFVDAKKMKASGMAITLHENYANEGRVRIGIVSLTGLSTSGELYEIKFKVIDEKAVLLILF